MHPSLRAEPFSAQRILITGAHGYVGMLVAATLLQHTASRLVCLTRATPHELLESLEEECLAQGAILSRAQINARIEHCALPPAWSELPALHRSLSDVDEIIHCAGSVDYHNEALLQSVNLDFTAQLLALGQRLPLKRFVFISTAFSGGYHPGVTLECALPEPPSDPTRYTRSKRQAEHQVAQSGLPFVVLRPSILIGTSTTGRYIGKRYGLYQHWMGLERLTCDRYHPEFHVVAQTLPVHVVHQDAFCAALAAGHTWLPDGAFCNLVSHPEHSPSMRAIWEMWFAVTQPQTVHYYPSMSVIPWRSVHPRQRAYLTFAHINLDIAAHDWRFATNWLDALRTTGMAWTDATYQTVRRCQARFIASSDVMQRYLAEHTHPDAPPAQIIEHPHPAPAHHARDVA